MEYIGLIVIVIIITLLWFVNYQNHSLTALALDQNQKIEKLNEQVNELIYHVQSNVIQPLLLARQGSVSKSKS